MRARGEFVAETVRASAAGTAPAGRSRRRSKSIDMRHVEAEAAGRSSAKASPSVDADRAQHLDHRRGASCSTMPAQSSRNTKGAAEPSRIGSSGPSIFDDEHCRCRSRRAPPSDARRCRSGLRAGSGSPSTVQRRKSRPESKRAGMSTPRSVGGTRCRDPPRPGRSVSETRLPGMQADAHAADRRLQRALPGARVRERNNRVGETVHARRLCPPHWVGQSIIIAECFRLGHGS